jgi:hypothetical protein
VKLLLAWVLTFALVNVITVCPVLAGGMEQSSCCPHSSGPKIPCTESTARNCPYVLLEKAKAEPGLSASSFDIVATPAPGELDPLGRLSTPIHPDYVTNYSGSYLLLRVLRL